MTHRFAAVLLTLAVFSAPPLHAQSVDDPTSIMRPEPGRPQELPEPWLPPKYKSPRGTRQHVVTPKRLEVPVPQANVPPPMYVPQTGQVLPNMPAVGASGPNGETSQDRALRCTHQAGAYGTAAGDRNAYVGSCINQ
jgi:hypothetical protein